MENKTLINFLGSFTFLTLGYLCFRKGLKSLRKESEAGKISWSAFLHDFLFAESVFFGLALMGIGLLMLFYSIKDLIA